MRNGILPSDYHPILQKTTIPLVIKQLAVLQISSLMLQEKFKTG
jgi:hypothetical protein